MVYISMLLYSYRDKFMMYKILFEFFNALVLNNSIQISHKIMIKITMNIYVL